MKALFAAIVLSALTAGASWAVLRYVDANSDISYTTEIRLDTPYSIFDRCVLGECSGSRVKLERLRGEYLDGYVVTGDVVAYTSTGLAFSFADKDTLGMTMFSGVNQDQRSRWGKVNSINGRHLEISPMQFVYVNMDSTYNLVKIDSLGFILETREMYTASHLKVESETLRRSIRDIFKDIMRISLMILSICILFSILSVIYSGGYTPDTSYDNSSFPKPRSVTISGTTYTATKDSSNETLYKSSTHGDDSRYRSTSTGMQRTRKP